MKNARVVGTVFQKDAFSFSSETVCKNESLRRIVHTFKVRMRTKQYICQVFRGLARLEVSGFETSNTFAAICGSVAHYRNM